MNTWIQERQRSWITYAGLRQVVDKYPVQDRSLVHCTKTQDMYMMIGGNTVPTIPKKTRMSYIKKYYDAISAF